MTTGLRPSERPHYSTRGGILIAPVPPPKRHPYDQWSPDARALDLVGDKWTLLIVRDLAGGPRRFVELQRTLPGISTEQLRSRLNRMVADGLLTRQRYREVPPRVDYELTARSRALLPVVGQLSRWGYGYAWGPPRPGERVDVGAIMRAATGLKVDSDLRGTVELVVTHPDKGDLHYGLRARDGMLVYSERPTPDALALVRGPERAWIEALGPVQSRTELADQRRRRVRTRAARRDRRPRGSAAAGRSLTTRRSTHPRPGRPAAGPDRLRGRAASSCVSARRARARRATARDRAPSRRPARSASLARPSTGGAVTRTASEPSARAPHALARTPAA